MNSVKGTQTEKNLLTSFAGECQARMRYNYFASAAKKEGYEQIAAIFEETANQEKEHAKRMFKYLEGGMVEITASYPAGVIGTTADNLRAAAAGENEEWTTDYPVSPRLQPKRVSPKLRLCIATSPSPRKVTKSVISRSWPTLRMAQYSRKPKILFGNVATAVSLWKAKKLPKHVPLACIPKLTLRS